MRRLVVFAIVTLLSAVAAFSRRHVVNSYYTSMNRRHMCWDDTDNRTNVIPLRPGQVTALPA